MPAKNYQTGDFVDFADIALTPAAAAAWSDIERRVSAFCRVLGVSKEQFPGQQIRLNADKSLSIFVVVTTPSGGEAIFDMNVPPSEWQWK